MRREEVQYTAKVQITRIFGLISRFLVVLLTAAISLTLPAAVLAQQTAESGTQALDAVRARAGEDDTVIAGTAPASGQADGEAAPMFGVKIPGSSRHDGRGSG